MSSALRLGVKNLTVTHSNLVVSWMDRPHMSIISFLNFHSDCAGSPMLVVFVLPLQLNLSICAQKTKKTPTINIHMQGLQVSTYQIWQLLLSTTICAMIGENRQLVTNEPVEFEK